MGKINDLVGKTFTRLTVISYSHNKGYTRYWNCRCECGAEKKVASSKLTCGTTKSCGCYKREVIFGMNRTHEESGKTKEYSTWCAVKYRCYYPSSNAYKHYGGRGIKMCDRWLKSYENFLVDMGRAPSKKHSIERNNVNGDYTPENCRWATKKEQANNTTANRIIECNGRRMTVSQWADETGFSYAFLHNRLCKGWSDEDTVTRPARYLKRDKNRGDV